MNGLSPNPTLKESELFGFFFFFECSSYTGQLILLFMRVNVTTVISKQ